MAEIQLNNLSSVNGARTPFVDVLTRAVAAAQAAEATRGRNVTILDLRELTSTFDFFVLVTASSQRQLHAISEAVDSVMKKDYGDRRMGREGYDESRWILLDYGDLVVHMFDDETREFYDLEGLWAGAKIVPFEHASPPSPVLDAENSAE